MDRAKHSNMDSSYCALAGDVLSRLSKTEEKNSQPLLARIQIVSVCVSCLVGLLVWLAGFRRFAFRDLSKIVPPRRCRADVFPALLDNDFFAGDRGATNRWICQSEAEPEVGNWPPPSCLALGPAALGVFQAGLSATAHGK